jgi:alcohol dehydrogenase
VGGLAQSVGIYAAGAAKALGAGRILYLDDDQVRRANAAAARRHGRTPEPAGATRQERRCRRWIAPQRQRRQRAVRHHRRCQRHADALDFAISSTAPNGVCTSIAIYLSPTPLPLTKMYGKGITFITGRVHSRASLPEVLDRLRSRPLPPRPGSTPAPDLFHVRRRSHDGCCPQDRLHQRPLSEPPA